MKFLTISLVRKFLLFFLLIGGLVYAVFYFLPEYFVYGVFAALVLLLGFLWWHFFRPLKTVMFEMQNLLAGKPYKKIFSLRIDEVGVLAYFFNKVTASLGEVSGDIKDRRRMIDELKIASQLQRDILPEGATLNNLVGMDLVAKTKPASELGGDSYNFFTVRDRTFVYIGDVTGHGVAAGLIMTMVNSLIAVFADLHDSPYEILVNVNRYIKRHVKKAMFMTLVMLCWDNKTQKMTFVGCGHEHILIYRAATGVCESIPAGGVALGMVPDNSKVIKEQVLELTVGDMVILYSDGITEARNGQGELFGLERLKELVVEYAAEKNSEGVHYRIATAVSEYSAGHDQADDMTLIVMKKQ